MLHRIAPCFQPSGESIREIIGIMLHDDSISMRFTRHGGVVNHPKPGDRDMKMKLNGGTVARTALAGIVGALMCGAAAHAAVATYNFDVRTSGYSDLSGNAAAPDDPVNVSFDVTFDPSQANIGIPVTFTTAPSSDFSGETFQFFNSVGPATFNLFGTSGCCFLRFQYVFSTPTIVPGTFQFQSGANDYGYYSINNGVDNFYDSVNNSPLSAGSVTITSISGVPEPTIWAMMLVGFGGMGAMLRGSRRRPSTVAA